MSKVTACLVALLASVSIPRPAAADFNDILQVICDEDLIITTGCDLIHDGLRFVATVAISADDKHVYICSSLADAPDEAPIQKETLSAYSRALDGTLTLVDQEIEDSGGVTTLASCRGVAVSPDGKHVYTAALTDRAVTWFSRDATTGALTFTPGDSVSGTPGSSLSGANAVVVSPDNKHVYVTGRSGDSIAAFSRDTTTGDLTSIADYFDGLDGLDGLDTPEDIAISPDGKHVYVASVGDDAVAVFSRNTNSGSGDFGKLTFVEARFDDVGGVDGLQDVSSLVLDPAGENLYTATQRSFEAGDWLAVFSRDPGTGALTFLQSLQSSTLSVQINCGGLGPIISGLAASPSGLFVAAAEPTVSALATFSRAADGTLTLVEAICDDLFVDSDNLGSIVEVEASADGKNLYTAGGAFSLHSVIDYQCDSANVDLVLTGDVSTVENETACRSILAEDYNVLAAGEVSMTAPKVALGNNSSVIGILTITSGVP